MAEAETFKNSRRVTSLDIGCSLLSAGGLAGDEGVDVLLAPDRAARRCSNSAAVRDLGAPLQYCGPPCKFPAIVRLIARMPVIV